MSNRDEAMENLEVAFEPTPPDSPDYIYEEDILNQTPIGHFGQTPEDSKDVLKEKDLERIANRKYGTNNQRANLGMWLQEQDL